MFKLYQMIWQRFVASQMVPAVFDQTTIDVDASDYTFRATGSVQKFDGYLAVYQAGEATRRREKEDEADAAGNRLPQVTEGEQLKLETIRPDQHFTEPPPRYTEATLVKELEEKGIGRPSTYASIISTIVEREYVNKDQGRFTPTMLGERVSVLLVKAFEDIFDVGFTARLEEELDEIEEGKLPWRDAVKEFWDRFEVDLGKAGRPDGFVQGRHSHGQEVREVRPGRIARAHQPPRIFPGLLALSRLRFHPDLADVVSEQPEGETATQYCDNCGKEMIIKRGRFGTFLACTGYPDCKTTRRLVQGTRKARQPDDPLDEKCPHVRQPALRAATDASANSSAAQEYPKCKYTRPITLGIKCPKCNEGEFVRRGTAKGRGRGANFLRLHPLSRLRFHDARTSRSTSRARSAARRLSSKSGRSRGISGRASRKDAIGKLKRRCRRWNLLARRRLRPYLLCCPNPSKPALPAKS